MRKVQSLFCHLATAHERWFSAQSWAQGGALGLISHLYLTPFSYDNQHLLRRLRLLKYPLHLKPQFQYVSYHLFQCRSLQSLVILVATTVTYSSEFRRMHFQLLAANLLLKLIQDVLQYPLLTTSWSKLLGFSLACLAKPSRGVKSRNLTTQIVKQIFQYDQGVVEPPSESIGCNHPRHVKQIHQGRHTTKP